MKILFKFLMSMSLLISFKDGLIIEAYKIEEGKKCRVMSLSGGGSKGAYEAGVIQTIANTLDE